MGINSKRGITVTSIVVYVILFFMFTTITSIISSRFNENLFNDRGMAINITEFNKLEYNLLESASNSYNATYETEENITTITFSNSDEYVFDKENHIIYKNGGKLVRFVKDVGVRLADDVLDIDITLNKYTNEIKRKIKVNIATQDYVDNGLIAHYDGINNVGSKAQDKTSMVWKDLRNENVQATLSSGFTHDGKTNGWVENGLLLPIKTNDYSFYAQAIYDTLVYPSMTVEIIITPTTQLGNEPDSYVYPVKMYDTSTTTVQSFYFGARKGITLMYGEGNNTVFYSGINITKDNRYTLTFVQDDLNSRSMYINGVFKQKLTLSNLTDIQISKLIISNHDKGSYIIHGVRMYNRALSEEEILYNHNSDIMRFGK